MSRTTLTTRTSLVRSFLCPSDGGPSRDPNRIAMTSYVGVHHDVEAPIAADNHGVLFLNSAVRVEDVTDGSSQHALRGREAQRRPGPGLGLRHPRQPEEHRACW